MCGCQLPRTLGARSLAVQIPRARARSDRQPSTEIATVVVLPASPLWSLCSAITSPFRQSDMPPPPLQPKFGAGPPPIPPRPHNMGTQQGGEPKRPYAPVYIPGTLTSWLIPNFELRVEDVSHPGAQLFFDSVRPADALKDAVISTCSWLYTLRDVPTK